MQVLSLGNQPLSRKYRDWLEQEARTPVYLPTSTRDAEGYPLQGVDVAGPPPRFERGIEPSVKEALVIGGLERRLDESLKTKVPRPVTEYEKWLIEEIQRLKKKDTVVKTDVPVPDRPLSEYERLLIEEIQRPKKKDTVV